MDMEVDDKNQEPAGNKTVPQGSGSPNEDNDNETIQSNTENTNPENDGTETEATPADVASSSPAANTVQEKDGETQGPEETEENCDDDQHSLDAVSDVSFESEDESLQTTKVNELSKESDPLNDIKNETNVSKDFEVVEDLEVLSEDDDVRQDTTSKNKINDADKDLSQETKETSASAPNDNNETSNQETVEETEPVADDVSSEKASTPIKEIATVNQDENSNQENPTTTEVVNTNDKDSTPQSEVCEVPTARKDVDETSNQDDSDVGLSVAEMMEVSMDENSQGLTETANEEEMEVQQIDSGDENSGQVYEEGDEAQPIVLNQNIFDDDENDDDYGITELDISSMMQVEVVEGDESVEHQFNIEEDESVEEENSEASTSTSRRPRRAAAAAAAKTIHKISSEEQDVSQVFRNRRKSQEDADFSLRDALSEMSSPVPSPSSSRTRQKCHVCHKNAACSIVIKQYGSDIYLCSNDCFGVFRNDGTECKSKTLACAKCGVANEENGSKKTDEAYFWETMNFCSDLCVGGYQIDVGSKCCTCGNNVSWTSLGKYCVRFGSDIRQFCMPTCLEAYKKNARVCFNCQLDIRRIGNVVLANIPSKTTPKEFCSNECVEMYCDRNVHQPTRAKPKTMSVCSSCNVRRFVHKELALTTGNHKTCSERCWEHTVKIKGVLKAEKCEMCIKYVNMDLGSTTPVYWLSSMDKVFGFCSHVCKNLYILNNRKILACNNCKVKKYNFDLIEFYKNGSLEYAACSLACLPKQKNHLKNLQDALYLPQPTASASIRFDETVPVINSVQSNAPPTTMESRNRLANNRKRLRENPPVSNQPQKEILVLDIANNDDDDDDDEIVTWADITKEEIANLLKFVDAHAPKRMMTKSCSAKPRVKTVETQTDISELNAMDRIAYAPDEIVHYFPVPIACPISMPFPGYFLESPVPIPFPLPIPYPVPIPIIIPSTAKTKLKLDDENKTITEEHEKKNSSGASDIPLASKVNGNDEITVVKDQTKTVKGSNESDVNEKSIAEPQIEVNRSTPSDSLGLDLNVPNPNLSTPVNINSVPCLPMGPYQPPVTPYQHQPSIPVMSPAYAPHIVPAIPSHPVVQAPLVRPTATRTPPRDYRLPHPAATHMPISPQVTSPYSFGAAMGNYNTNPSVSPLHYPMSPVPMPSYSPQSAPTMNYMTPIQSSGGSSPMSTVPNAPPKQDRVDYAIRAWKMMFGAMSDPASLSSMELSAKLIELVNRGSKPNGEKYRSDVLLYICLGIQKLLSDCNRADKLFYDNMYYNFVIAFTDSAEREVTMGINPTIEESHFWESFELGASSPGVLLFTLIFMFQKYFGLKTWEMQVALQFGHIVIQVRYDQFGKPERYLSLVGLPGVVVGEVKENVNDPKRCFVNIYEFYKSTSENPTGPFYKCLRQDYTPRTSWFTSQPLGQLHIYQMLVRASMIKSTNQN